MSTEAAPPPPAAREGRAPAALDSTRAWQRFLVAAVRRAERRVQTMPRAAALRLGVGLGRVSCAVSGRQRFFAERNLRLAYGNSLTPAQRADLTRRVFESFGQTAIDFVRSPLIRTRADLAALVPEVVGWAEHVAPHIAAGRPVVFTGAHLGNWEMLGRWIAAQGVTLTVVAREPDDPTFGGWVRSVRENAGFRVADKGGSAKRLLSALRRGESLGVLPDQNSGDLFVPFFGIPCGTVAGPALFALRTGAAIIPSYCVRRPDGLYRMLFLAPVPVEPTGNQDGDVARTMAAVNRVLEGVIREYSDQWLWLHNRWKSAFEEKNLVRWPEGYALTPSVRAAWEGQVRANDGGLRGLG
jgi:KDO2-lipid IV(A) lauroyltransferase